ncbi:hypothetical protein BDU57DRAFT_519847 [Ampelomyces quisqualis]|uniref:Uncharacterized protein n=1 Tax=Ampelomyces quisqualis TaxID=50730 RepID=A0A6A5QIM9_AMPQU|nr:hypothetical protein BDU57DRAFT_519847 [Ampelomyces quisqualis]
MPSIFSKKSNRSHQSVDTTAGQSAHQQPLDALAHAANNEGAQRFQQPTDGQPGVAPGQYQQPPQQYPTRTTGAHRLSAHLDHAAQDYQQEQQQPGSLHAQSPPPAAAHEPKKSLRSRIAGLAGRDRDEDPSRQASKNGLGRRKSVRTSDPRLVEQQQQRHQGSSPHLPASKEHDEDNLDPFLQQDGPSQPQVPPKDYPQRPQQPPYRPPLDRASTEGSYRTQDGVAPSHQHSPDHHQGQALQPQQQPAQQHQSYPPAAHPANPTAAPHQPPVYYHQQGPPIDAPQSQQLRPPSSQPLPPPSPLQAQPYQAYDSQPAQPPQPQPSDPLSASATPLPQGQTNMPSSAPNPGRNTLRKVVDGQHPGPPSRESSLLQQPSGQGQPYRGEKGQQAQQAQSGGDMGRATPPPRPSVADMSDEEIEKMIKEYEVLREKYQKVKRYFFEQQTQVHQLQNTLANQRLSLSRTSWDDSEYATRFNRLDGLIAQLSFSIRKDWRAIPQFLHTVVNKTAVETGKQEMTAVGRAFISYWLVENIFEKYFHPDLEPGFSTQLQGIVMNIRKFSPACHSPEDEDSLAAKIINWRLATLEGLADTLRAPQAAKYRQELIETLNEKLIASLQMHMNDPAPPDLNGGVPMIIELAVGIAQHMPLESREVHIEYFPPGHSIVPDFMKLETGVPLLTAPILDIDEADRASVRSAASKDVDSISIAEQEQLAAQQQNAQLPKEEKKRNVFGFGGGSKKPTTAPASLGKRESTLGAGGSQQSLMQNPPGSSHGSKDEPAASRVRMAVGVAVQIRGKSILMKAPVYSI